MSNDGVFIDYRSCGEADVTSLFVHGWAIDQTYRSSQVEAFCPEYRVVTIDLPGHGSSGTNRDRWTVEAYASDVRAAIDQLELDHVILIGHSMAGDIILEAALIVFPGSTRVRWSCWRSVNVVSKAGSIAQTWVPGGTRSIQVLRGVGAVARFGAEASDGVVLVTTKDA